MNKDDISKRIVLWNKKQNPPQSFRVHASCSQDIHIKTQKIPFHCQICDSGKDGSWSTVYHNFISGKGCPCCKRNQEVLNKFLENKYFSENFELVIENNQNGIPDTKKIRYKLRNKKTGSLTSGIGSQRNYFLRCIKDNRIPDALNFDKKQEIESIKLYFLSVYPKSEIDYNCDIKNNCTSPGPFFDINIIDSCIGKNFSKKEVSIFGINKIINYEINYRKKLIDINAIAKRNGASILKYSYKKNLLIHYISRTGQKIIHTYHRAIDTNWGQSGFHKGEKLCRSILIELFPNQKESWKWNCRADFLRYNKHNLELDGFNRDLKLAFEHQGAQHYAEIEGFSDKSTPLEEIKKRDVFKVEKCKLKEVSLLIINQKNKNLDPEQYLLDITRQLECFGINYNKEYNLNKIEEIWDKMASNPLQSFQNRFKSKLNKHILISPEIGKVNSGIKVKYQCSFCNEIIESRAKSIADAKKPLKFCPKCKNTRKNLHRYEHTT